MTKIKVNYDEANITVRELDGIEKSGTGGNIKEIHTRGDLTFTGRSEKTNQLLDRVENILSRASGQEANNLRKTIDNVRQSDEKQAGDVKK